MPDEIKIRRSIPSDDLQLGELLVDAYVKTYAEKLPDVVVSDARKADLRDTALRRQEAFVLVAEGNGEVIGTLTLFKPGSSDSKAWRKDGAEIRYMALDRNFHRQGISSQLLKEAAVVARSWHAACICLHVRQTALGVARMYAKNGFVRHPEGDRDERPEIFLEAYYLPLGPSRPISQ